VTAQEKAKRHDAAGGAGEGDGDGDGDDNNSDATTIPDSVFDGSAPPTPEPAKQQGKKAAKAAGSKGAAGAAVDHSTATSGKKRAKKPAGDGLCEVGGGGAEALGEGAGGVKVDFRQHTCQVVVQLPLRAPKLLMLEVVERVAAAVTVRATPSIDKVHVMELMWPHGSLPVHGLLQGTGMGTRRHLTRIACS
jgi:hypothetical protein